MQYSPGMLERRLLTAVLECFVTCKLKDELTLGTWRETFSLGLLNSSRDKNMSDVVQKSGWSYFDRYSVTSVVTLARTRSVHLYSNAGR